MRSKSQVMFSGYMYSCHRDLDRTFIIPFPAVLLAEAYVILWTTTVGDIYERLRYEIHLCPVRIWVSSRHLCVSSSRLRMSREYSNDIIFIVRDVRGLFFDIEAL